MVSEPKKDESASAPAVQAPVIHIPAGQDQPVRIQVMNAEPVYQGRPVKQRDYSDRTLGALAGGLIGAIAGGFGTAAWLGRALFDFRTEVAGQTKGNILGPRGLGGAIAETGGFGGMAGGFASGEIHTANALALAKTGKYGSLPKFVYTIPGGESTLILGGAAVAGTLAAMAGYSMTKDKPKPGADAAGKDWAEKTATDKDKPRELS
ncbi:MAG: hypothetical protein K2Q01_11010 [Rickettsiales bacterium]|nr:hypothetical protein [Rickettsiales bacterium]